MIFRIVLMSLVVCLCVCQEPHCSSFTFLEQLLEKLVRMETRVSSLETQFKVQLKSDASSAPVQAEHTAVKVAFSASATKKQSNLQDKQVLVFDHVFSNVGKSYDKNTETFTVPVDGVYSFHTTVLTNTDVEIWGYIDVNDSPQVRYNARGTDGRVDSGSQSLIISLSNGDKVTVRNRFNKGNFYGNHYTTFSGYLLFEA